MTNHRTLVHAPSARRVAALTAALLMLVGLIQLVPTGQAVAASEISAKYESYGGASSRLGQPTSKEVCGLRRGGCYQNFQGGAIYWSEATGAHVSVGSIRGKWVSLDSHRGFLGYPTSDEVCGLKGGGCYQSFEGGQIHWSPATGSHPTSGRIAQAWELAGKEEGSLGYPTGDEDCEVDGYGCIQDFQYGQIVRQNRDGFFAYIMAGAIKDAWYGKDLSLILEYPVSDQVCGLPPEGGCIQLFQFGQIAWSPSTGAHGVLRDIANYWEDHGWWDGPLGYPLDDTGFDNGTVFQYFQGGFVYFDSNGRRSVVEGATYETWYAAGGLSSQYGAPVGDASCDEDGTCTQEFEHGTITRYADGTVKP
ncbi:LGFP [Propionibacterium ruminifibrarum]|uniref:LGFP n=1 Tax=Propionibacterium ruminifibrarum TaxID=1962131 RepID=A0A375I4W4_9ACTN|nr:hypothetical protein [Propionibacterium ruminifibrarum]SPF69151.1 LGFP [Propionibacterium ruminifibrarum]